jgi:hypothetical protein
MCKNISNIHLLIDLQLINNKFLFNYEGNNPYKNVYRIIELRNKLKKDDISLIKIINIYIELIKCLYQFDNDIKKNDNESPNNNKCNYVASPIYHILLSDDDLHYMIH